MDAEYWSEGPLCRLNFGISGYCFRCLLHGKAWMFGSWVLRIDLMGSHAVRSQTLRSLAHTNI